jgi:hypothetical protein
MFPDLIRCKIIVLIQEIAFDSRFLKMRIICQLKRINITFALALAQVAEMVDAHG